MFKFNVHPTNENKIRGFALIAIKDINEAEIMEPWLWFWIPLHCKPLNSDATLKGYWIFCYCDP